jgi:ABC-type Fe3+-hydroxamate transport system substrate-binding protein
MHGVVQDQLHREIFIPAAPRRIISLVPSQTELLSDLGLHEEVVGITKFCISPDTWFRTKPKIGGTKKFNFGAIDDLQPDLIIGNKEENYPEGIAALAEKYPVWMSDISSLQDAYYMIASIGGITGRPEKANAIILNIRNAFLRLKKQKPARVLYLIWRNPWMGAGIGTFIHTMITEIGLENALSESRYPQLSEDLIRQLAPEVILLSSEPFPFTESHVREMKGISPSSKIVLIDATYFSWYGSRLVQAPDYFNSLVL